MAFVEKMALNLADLPLAAASFTIRGLHESVAYFGTVDRTYAVQNAGIALSPISLALDQPLDFRASLSREDTARVQNGILTLGRLVIDLRTARTVDLSLSPTRDPNTIRARIPECLGLVRAVLADTLATRTAAAETGFGDLLLPFRSLRPLTRPASPAGQMDVRGAFVSRLNALLEPGAPEAAAPAIASLTGLGPGLTPSGDDFLIGLLSALWFFKGIRPAESLLQALRPEIRLRLGGTTPVSAAFLGEAAEGRFGERICGFWTGIGQGSWDQALQDLTAVARTGHSSGTDTLGGMIFGLVLLRDPAIHDDPGSPDHPGN